MNRFLFININFLNNIKDQDLKNNLKKHFLYEIHKKFIKISKNFEIFNAFLLEIKNSNNDSLFYTGVEDHIKIKFDLKKSKIEKWFKNIFGFEYNVAFIKTKIAKNKKLSLVSLLMIVARENIVNYDNENLEQKNYLFFLFPIDLDDYHK